MTTPDLSLSPPPAPAVARAVAILTALAAGPTSLADLARDLGAPKSSLLNVLRTLEADDMVRRSGPDWALGFRVVELGQAFLAGTDTVTEFRRLAAQFETLSQETSLLATLDGVDVVYLARHDGTQPIRLASDIGRRLPAAVTALGKAMLASLDDASLAAWLSAIGPLPALTPASFRTIEELRADLLATRERGYSVDDEQNTVGVKCFGVALPRTPGSEGPLMAASVTMLAQRVTATLEQKVIDDLRGLAAELGPTVR